MATYAEIVVCEMNEALRSGQPEEIIRYATRFLELTNESSRIWVNGKVGLPGKDGAWYIPLEDSGGRKMDLCRDGRSWRIGGRKISDHDVAMELGVPIPFLDGASWVLDALGPITEWTTRGQDLLDRVSALLREVKRVSEASHIAKSARRKERSILKGRLARSMKKDRRECAMVIAAERVRKAQSISSLPPVPEPTQTANDIAKGDRIGGGIYVAWDEKGCKYVGKAVCFKSRLGPSHHKVKQGDLVSLIPFNGSDIDRAEYPYIWMLRPRLNGRSAT